MDSTKLDVATKIMAGIVASKPIDYIRVDGTNVIWSPEKMAKHAMSCTNALLKELNVSETNETR